MAIWVFATLSRYAGGAQGRPYRLSFYSHAPNEPAHVHVDRDDMSVKFWLAPVTLARHFGFGAVELGKVESLVKQNQTDLLETWQY